MTLQEFLAQGMSAERARELFDAHARLVDGHWKGALEAVVPEALGAEVAEAMAFFAGGAEAPVALAGGLVRVTSRGYHHYVGA